ncbi:hypothetical protein BCR34DRAFT_69839 [Clohesyomyces aquaticus]|uniref:NACHT domain-containing protein n=1 Tax=Clohesyomyces aquaticus TaxID=1231657 RepID=A0A1Y1Z046_9PLEO|nr:hypothetical protein BCR34DRAFT_69839 [Clohesyomyces aquaticus]
MMTVPQMTNTAVFLGDNNKGTNVGQLFVNEDDPFHWLPKLDHTRDPQTFLGSKAEGTCGWFLRSDEFVKWKQGEQRTLWCPGDAGVGKTFLASLVIQHLLDDSNLNDVRVLYVYFRHGFNTENQPYLTISTLLRQLLLSNGKYKHSASAIKLDATYKERTDTNPPVRELLETLAEEVNQYGKVYVVLDALDESSGWNGDSGAKSQMRHGIKRLQQMSKVNLMITSRSHADPGQELFGFLSTKTETDTFMVTMKEIYANADDIRSYAEFMIQEASYPGDPFANVLRLSRDDTAGLKKDIVDAVVLAAGKLFLLAVLQLKSITGTSTPAQLEEALINLPTTLTDQFQDMQKRIEAQTQNLGDRDAAKRALSWICAAARPMALAELQHALAIKAPTWAANKKEFHQDSHLITLCAGFLILPEDQEVSQMGNQQSRRLEDRTVEFVHATAREYIGKSLLGRAVRRSMAEVCIGYLSNGQLMHPTCTSDEALTERLKNSRFLLYAACHWGHHLRLHENSNESTVKRPDPRWWTMMTTWISGWQKTAKTPIPSVTQMAVDMLGKEEALLNLSQLMHIPTYKRPGFSQRFPQSMTALHFAARFGVLELTQRILAINSSKFLDVDKDLRAQKNVPDDGHDGPGALGQNGGDRVKYIDAKDTYMKTAMHVAARRGHDKIVGTLIQHGAKFEETTGDGETPLLSGAMNGDFNVVQVLLSKGHSQATGIWSRSLGDC